LFLCSFVLWFACSFVLWFACSFVRLFFGSQFSVFIMLITLDTSTAYIGVACYDAQGLLGECTWRSGRDHTTQLLPQLAMLLRHVGRTPAQISAVAVALGPGSWSGLRVGMSAAKGITLARRLPLIGIGTLDALAYQYGRSGLQVVPLIRLGRDRFATATYADQLPWSRMSDYRNVTLAELGAEVQSHALFCGDVDAETQELLRHGLHKRAHFPAGADNLRRPGYLAELAWQRLQDGDVDDLGTLEPIYLGQPVRGAA
jgi:tRNA threonylcarbamoyladenosine biosynthesis protein TsaB